jgi:hypothetical protein
MTTATRKLRPVHPSVRSLISLPAGARDVGAIHRADLAGSALTIGLVVGAG